MRNEEAFWTYGRTSKQTDGQMDGKTDKPSYRDARMHLNQTKIVERKCTIHWFLRIWRWSYSSHEIKRKLFDDILLIVKAIRSELKQLSMTQCKLRPTFEFHGGKKWYVMKIILCIGNLLYYIHDPLSKWKKCKKKFFFDELSISKRIDFNLLNFCYNIW